MHLWCWTFWSLNTAIKVKHINKARDALNVMQAAPPILQLKEIRAFTAKPWSQQGIAGSPLLHPQLQPRFQPPWRHPAEGMTCREDGVVVGTSSARCKDTKINHYECGDLPLLVRCRLLLGKLTYKSSLLVVLFSHLLLWEEQHPGLGTPPRHPGA